MTRKDSSSIKDYIITALWLIVAGVIMTLITFPPTGDRKMSTFILVAAFTSSIWVFLWLGNAITSDLVSLKIEWTKTPIKRFVVGMLVMIVYTGSVTYGLVWIFRVAFDLNFDTRGFLYGSLIVTFIISSFMHSRGFLQSWRQAEVEAEKAKQESIKANYESLKNQVNPHFLFNSLNALTALVYEDQDKAAKFIKQLSEVYRYVLDMRNKEIVDIEEELEFLASYLFLQKIRFGDKLIINNELDHIEGSVPPLAIQMLFENAIKHNIISEEQPLTINLFKEQGMLVVKNNLQVKNVISEDSASLGLENIKRRYEFLSNRPIEIVKDTNSFQVKLPILLKENEGINN